MAYTTEKHDQRVQQIVERDTSIGPDAVRPEVVIRGPAGGAIGGGALGVVDTELPAAAALADNTANPTAPAVGAHLLGWDNATWDRIKLASPTGSFVPGDGINGILAVAPQLWDGVGLAYFAQRSARSSGDGGDGAQAPPAAGLRWNGASWDRVRNNHQQTALVSVVRNASVNSADLVNYNGAALIVVIDVTAIVASPSVVFTVVGKDELSGQYFTLLASAAITGVGTTVLEIGAGLVAVANLVACKDIPRIVRVQAVHADADDITYSVACLFVGGG